MNCVCSAFNDFGLKRWCQKGFEALGSVVILSVYSVPVQYLSKEFHVF